MNKVKKLLKKIASAIRSCVPLWAGALYILFAVCAVLYGLFMYSEAFADMFNMSVSRVFRTVMGKITSFIPVSLAEMLIFSSPVILFLVIRGVFRYMDSRDHGFARCVVSLVSVLALLFSMFTLGFAAGYRTPTLDRKLGLETGEVSPEELRAAADYTVECLNSLADSVMFVGDSSVRGYTHGDTVDKAYESYEALSKEYDFITNFKAPVKRLAISPVMTYTHISGVYTFFTGEANLNTNYPEYVNVFTTAHEMAHQRGIARENEANFVAYLVCINSDDPYMQYSGHLNMFEYLVSALSEVSQDDARELYSALDSRVYGELVSYSKFFKKYSNSKASEVAGTVNNAYLQSQGTPGTRSYGMVVDLAVEYYLEREAEE